MNQKECTTFNTLMVDALYGELQKKDKGFFHSHLESCDSCREEYNQMSAALGVMDYRSHPEPDEEYWNNFLPQLQDKIAETEKVTTESSIERLKSWWGKMNFNFNMQWVLYPTAALFLIVSGIVVARYLYVPEVEEYTETTVASISPEVSEHFNNIQPLLVDYSNYSTKPDNSDGSSDAGNDDSNIVWVDRDELKSLVAQNYLLKKVVERENNPSLKLLLEDLELILTEMSNSDSNGHRNDSIETVQSIIKENDVLFKMKVYNKNNRKPVQMF